jgi:hypothetical protein
MLSSADSRIGPEWTLVAHGPDTVELRTGVWNTQTLTLNDDSRQGHLWLVLKALREGRTADAITADTGVPSTDVEALIDQLIGLGVISNGSRSALDTYLGDAASGRSGVTAAPARVVLLGDNPIHERVLVDLGGRLGCPVDVLGTETSLFAALTALEPQSFTDGLGAEAIGEQFRELVDTFVVCAATRNDPVRFQILDDLARIVGFTWIHAVIDGPFVYIGPTVVPFRTAGYRTFEARVAMNIRENESYLKYKEALVDHRVIESGSAVFEPLAGLVASHVALEVANWVATGSNFTVNKVLGIYLPTMEIAYHEIMPLPGEGARSPLQNRDATGLYFDIREWLVDGRAAAS